MSRELLDQLIELIEQSRLRELVYTNSRTRIRLVKRDEAPMTAMTSPECPDVSPPTELAPPSPGRGHALVRSRAARGGATMTHDELGSLIARLSVARISECEYKTDEIEIRVSFDRTRQDVICSGQTGVFHSKHPLAGMVSAREGEVVAQGQILATCVRVPSCDP